MAETQVITPYDTVPYLELNNESLESRHGANYFSNVKQFAAGFGSQVFRVDRDGLWLGAETFAAAPFSVDMQGNVTLTSITALTGFYDTDLTSISLPSNGIRIDSNGIYGRKSGATTFSIDTSGNAFFEGSIDASAITGTTITGGTIQTATTGLRLVMDGSNNAYEFRDGATLLCALEAAIVPNSGTAGAYLAHPTDNAYMGVSGSAGSGWATLGGSGGYFAVSSTVSTSHVETDLEVNILGGANLFLQEGAVVLEETGAGTSTISIQAPASTTTWILTLPIDNGVNGEVLTTDGSGNTSWSAVSGGADTDLNNLTTTLINQSLIPADGTVDLGTSSLPWDRGYIDDVYLTNGDGGIYYNANLALDFYATRIELGSTYSDFSPATSLSANLGATNRWNDFRVDTIDATGDIDTTANMHCDGLRLLTGTAHNPATEGEITFYDSGSIQYRGQIISTDYSFDLTAA